MGQQYCCGNRVKMPDLDDDLHITNEELLQEIKELREQYKEDIEQSQILMQGEAIFRGKLDQNRLKFGYGEHYFKNFVYFGLFEKDEPNGHGLAIKDDYSFYKGEFKNKHFHGFGKEYGNNYSFEGQFENGCRKKGVFKNDNFQYHGSFRNNTFQGEGTIVFTNETKYQGGFVRGKMEGKGVLVFPNGKFFKGEMVNGKCKQGKFYWPKDIKIISFDAHQVTQQQEQLSEFESPTDSLLQMLKTPKRNKQLLSRANAQIQKTVSP